MSTEDRSKAEILAEFRALQIQYGLKVKHLQEKYTEIARLNAALNNALAKEHDWQSRCESARAIVVNRDAEIARLRKERAESIMAAKNWAQVASREGKAAQAENSLMITERMRAESAEAQVAALTAELAEAKREDGIAREMLWINHSKGLGYGDDGEMQYMGLDYKRDSFELIRVTIIKRNMADPKLHEAIAAIDSARKGSDHA